VSANRQKAEVSFPILKKQTLQVRLASESGPSGGLPKESECSQLPTLRNSSSTMIICLAVMMYVKFPLSLRFVEDLRQERGIDISYKTISYCWNRFGPLFAAEIRKHRTTHPVYYSKWRWRLDEVFVKINGETHYLWRAVDHEGEVLESFVTNVAIARLLPVFSKIR
jgi:hypothetical protein